MKKKREKCSQSMCHSSYSGAQLNHMYIQIQHEHWISVRHSQAWWNPHLGGDEVPRAFPHNHALSSPSHIISAAQVLHIAELNGTQGLREWGIEDYWQEQARKQRLLLNLHGICTTQSKLKNSPIIHLLDTKVHMPRKDKESKQFQICLFIIALPVFLLGLLWM